MNGFWQVALLFTVGLYAGVQNAFAGGASFITLPFLLLTGENALAANVTSTIALFPGQIATGFASKSSLPEEKALSLRALIVVCLIGGAFGAVLLLLTPPALFERLLPWLVLFATAVFAWSNFGRKFGIGGLHMNRTAIVLMHIPIAVYGGYFGGGIGFLMLAALTSIGVPTRPALAIKNVLAGAMNAAAVLIFASSPNVHWLSALALCLGAIIGGLCAIKLLHRLNDNVLRIIVVTIGALLTVGLFIRAY